MVDQNHVAPLIPRSARTAHAALVTALGTENNPRQWMLFMQTVTRLLPAILSNGRPPKDQIKHSILGQLGFTSWQAMIEAPTEANGLAWNFSAWKAWRRAWSTVEKHPWLMYTEHGYTSSEVNTMAIEAKRDGVDFPASAVDLDERLSVRKAAKDARRAESMQSLAQREEAAAIELAVAQNDIRNLEVKVRLSAERERELLEKVKAGTEREQNLAAETKAGAERERNLIEELARLKAELSAIAQDQQTAAALAEQMKANAERERVLIAEVAELKAQLAGIAHDQQTVAGLAEQVGTLKAEVAAITKSRDSWKTKAEAKPKSVPRHGILQRIASLFR